MNLNSQLWIEPVGDIIIVRFRGVFNEDLIVECQKRLLQLLKDTQIRNVLYDILEVESVPAELTMVQWTLDQNLGNITLRRAVVVPNTRFAYLARIAFGEPDLRIFYNDIAGATQWLTD